MTIRNRHCCVLVADRPLPGAGGSGRGLRSACAGLLVQWPPTSGPRLDLTVGPVRPGLLPARAQRRRLPVQFLVQQNSDTERCRGPAFNPVSESQKVVGADRDDVRHVRPAAAAGARGWALRIAGAGAGIAGEVGVPEGAGEGVEVCDPARHVEERCAGHGGGEPAAQAVAAGKGSGRSAPP